jgi:hypothetical protein
MKYRCIPACSVPTVALLLTRLSSLLEALEAERASDRLTHLSGYYRPELSFGDVSGRNHKETSVSCVVSLTSATFNASRSVSSRGSAERDKERKLRSRLEPLTCSLRVSLFLIPNPAKDGYFAGTHESALSAKYPPISLNGASTADNC